MIHVAAGVLVDADGRVLLAERPAGKHLAGRWEFPGGKLEPDETPAAALARELHEELGIVARAAAPLFELSWNYGELQLQFYVRRVTLWDGEPLPLENQRLQWMAPERAVRAWLAPADRRMLELLLG